MTVVFNAIDEEFAAATGSNVGVTANTSIFDNPPNAFKDLLITSNAGDPSPNTFSQGDTYDLTWGGHGGGGVVEDAMVVRSDAAPGDGGIIVFEGTNQVNGETVQIIWTPDFNLENWYWSNYTPSADPQFWTTDQVSSYNHSFVCFAADTRIKTARGAVEAGNIRTQDQVLTLDAGYQPVLWVGRKTVRGFGVNAPVRFAPGVLGNHRPLVLSQQHRIYLRSAMAELFFGHQEVLVSAKSMLGDSGVSLAPVQQVQYVHLLLEDHHLLSANGALCESLFMGEMTDSITSHHMTSADRAKFAKLDHIAARPILTYREARCIVGAGAHQVTAVQI